MVSNIAFPPLRSATTAYAAPLFATSRSPLHVSTGATLWKETSRYVRNLKGVFLFNFDTRPSCCADIGVMCLGWGGGAIDPWSASPFVAKVSPERLGWMLERAEEDRCLFISVRHTYLHCACVNAKHLIQQYVLERFDTRCPSPALSCDGMTAFVQAHFFSNFTLSFPCPSRRQQSIYLTRFRRSSCLILRSPFPIVLSAASTR